MAYGILKCDTVTFTNDGVDKSITLSGLVQNPTFSGNVTVTGTLSGVTVTGTTANFTSGNFTNISGGTQTITSGVFAAGSAASPSITFTGDLNTGIYSPGADQLALSTNGTGRLFVDASGRLLVGTSSARAQFLVTPQFEIEGTSSSTSSIGLINNQSTNAGPYLFFGKTRGTAVGGVAAVQLGDVLGGIYFQGANGTNLSNCGASIESYVDAAVSGGGANDMPGRLVFSTTADGASSPTERMRIQSDGNVVIGKAGQTISYQNPGISLFSSGSADFTRASNYLISVNRKTDDGVLVEFYQDNNLEGTISVSGTTVSYNGAHLSRWSQLPSGAERTEILRGTVLSNIDEMCEWGDEDNEQLNRMKVSDVEGDKNVSGVFQAWDDDDDTYTNDFYCAMTGDFIIRIGAGVTVERGDLLMSAGDGTAKPQDDDIIRSKTVAKVTSTNVSCTYDDGSYCVPCVLMAC